MNANPFIQFRLSNPERQIWQADDLNSNRVFNVSTPIVAFVIAVETHGFDIAVQKILDAGVLANTTLNTFIDSLAKIEILVSTKRRAELEVKYKAFFALNWSQSPAWIESLQYLIAGHDFPFVDYSPTSDGRKQASDRMHRYASIERDNKRFKVFAPDQIQATENLPPVLKAVNNIVESSSTSADQRIRDVCSGIFGMTKTVKLAWDGEKLFRRTSPSGGSRHPSEGYLLMREPDAAYHIRTEGPALDRISAGNGILDRILPSAGPSASGAILFSSRFERNMFRYREPRTFRTVHMDVGHLVSTAARYLEVAGFSKIRFINSFDHHAFSSLSGCDGLEEGLISAVVFSAKKVQ